MNVVRRPAANLNPGVGPQNVGLPGYRPGDVGNPNGQLAPGPTGVPAPLQPPGLPGVAPAAAPVKPPLNYDDILKNPQYLEAAGQLDEKNRLNVADINRSFAGQAQSSQDAFNSHGGLFSGANINAHQNLVGVGGAQERALNAQDLQNRSAHTTLHQNVFNTLLNSLAPPSGA